MKNTNNISEEYSVLGILACHIIIDTETIPAWKIFLSQNNKTYVIKLYVINGKCPSGYTEASWGYNVFQEYKNSLPKGLLKPKKQTTIKYQESPNCSNIIFTCNYNGDNFWYPNGSISINRNLFH